MEKAMSFFLFIHQFAPAQKFPQILGTGFNSIGTKDHVGGRFVYHFQPLVAASLTAIFTYQPNLDKNKEPNQGKRSGSKADRD